MNNGKLQRMLKMAATPRQWFNIDTSGEEADVYIYDQIGMDWWGDGLSPQAFILAVNNLDASVINVRINSPGGYVDDGFAIYNFLNQLDKEVNTFNDGIAASIASVIFMAGDKRYTAENASLMIHDPWSIIAGNSTDMRKEAETLDTLKSQIAGVYASRSGLDTDEIGRLMLDETWITGESAVVDGWADEIIENKKAAACAFDLGIFDNIPENIKNLSNANKKRNLEASLRDAGWSRNEAKRLAAGPEHRDDEHETVLIDGVLASIGKNLTILKG